MKIVCFSIQTFCWKFFLKKKCFIFFPDNQRCNFGLLSKKVSAEFSKLHPTCWQSLLRESSFLVFSEQNFFPSFQDSEQRSFGLLSKEFRRVGQDSILRVHRNILIEHFNEKKCSWFFRHSAIKLWSSVQMFSAELWKRHPTCPEESFEEVFFWNFWIFCGHWELIFRPFIQKISLRLSKLYSTCP